jgi:uncharacterized protein YcbK (DUF882 family)
VSVGELSRRSVLAGLAALAAVPAGAAQGPLVQTRFSGIGQRFLWVKLAGRWEELQVPFRHADGSLDEYGAARLSWAFRDWRDADQSIWMDPRLFDLLAAIQTEATILTDMAVRINLTSGFRTARRNRSIEGAAYDSQHLKGRAADIVLTGLTPGETAAIAETLGAHGIGRYPGFTHVDVGPPGRRW